MSLLSEQRRSKVSRLRLKHQVKSWWLISINQPITELQSSHLSSDNYRCLEERWKHPLPHESAEQIWINAEYYKRSFIQLHTPSDTWWSSAASWMKGKFIFSKLEQSDFSRCLDFAGLRYMSLWESLVIHLQSNVWFTASLQDIQNESSSFLPASCSETASPKDTMGSFGLSSEDKHCFSHLFTIARDNDKDNILKGSHMESI